MKTEKRLTIIFAILVVLGTVTYMVSDYVSCRTLHKMRGISFSYDYDTNKIKYVSNSYEKSGTPTLEEFSNIMVNDFHVTWSELYIIKLWQSCRRVGGFDWKTVLNKVYY